MTLSATQALAAVPGERVGNRAAAVGARDGSGRSRLLGRAGCADVRRLARIVCVVRPAVVGRTGFAAPGIACDHLGGGPRRHSLRTRQRAQSHPHSHPDGRSSPCPILHDGSPFAHVSTPTLVGNGSGGKVLTARDGTNAPLAEKFRPTSFEPLRDVPSGCPRPAGSPTVRPRKCRGWSTVLRSPRIPGLAERHPTVRDGARRCATRSRVTGGCVRGHPAGYADPPEPCHCHLRVVLRVGLRRSNRPRCGRRPERARCWP